ncbi:unnamed protein product [Dibothriocephalus latus]|uniref:Uncharacterized protein n=1 Tax=Dibothriocephalus latus TaxID=60516 RepID=A0A3P7P2A5_DIBLA|nr:unnamed protein product [Dibothriocephalus latus]
MGSKVVVCDKHLTDENVDPVPVTSFMADIVVGKGQRPLTEAEKYKMAKSHMRPILEKLKSCGTGRFLELLREVNAFAERIMNAPGCLQGSFVDSPAQPSGVPMEKDVKEEVVRCMVREEGDVFIAQMVSSGESSVCVLRNDKLLPNFRIRGHPCMQQPWLTRKPLRSRPMNITVSTNIASTSTHMDIKLPSRHLGENVVDLNDNPFVDACGACGGYTVGAPESTLDSTTERVAYDYDRIHEYASAVLKDGEIYTVNKAFRLGKADPGRDLKQTQGLLKLSSITKARHRNY